MPTNWEYQRKKTREGTEDLQARADKQRAEAKAKRQGPEEPRYPAIPDEYDNPAPKVPKEYAPGYTDDDLFKRFLRKIKGAPAIPEDYEPGYGPGDDTLDKAREFAKSEGLDQAEQQDFVSSVGARLSKPWETDIAAEDAPYTPATEAPAKEGRKTPGLKAPGKPELTEIPSVEADLAKANQSLADELKQINADYKTEKDALRQAEYREAMVNGIAQIAASLIGGLRGVPVGKLDLTHKDWIKRQMAARDDAEDLRKQAKEKTEARKGELAQRISEAEKARQRDLEGWTIDNQKFANDIKLLEQATSGPMNEAKLEQARALAKYYVAMANATAPNTKEEAAKQKAFGQVMDDVTKAAVDYKTKNPTQGKLLLKGAMPAYKQYLATGGTPIDPALWDDGDPTKIQDALLEAQAKAAPQAAAPGRTYSARELSRAAMEIAKRKANALQADGEQVGKVEFNQLVNQAYKALKQQQAAGVDLESLIGQ